MTVYFPFVRGTIMLAALHKDDSGSAGNDTSECEANG